ncbi:unnamed protein product, partial [Polarella glacialis]
MGNPSVNPVNNNDHHNNDNNNNDNDNNDNNDKNNKNKNNNNDSNNNKSNTPSVSPVESGPSCAKPGLVKFAACEVASNRFVAILDTRSAAEKAFLSSMLSLNNRLLAGAVVRNATRKAAMVEALRGAKDEARPLAKLLVASAIRRAGA